MAIKLIGPGPGKKTGGLAGLVEAMSSGYKEYSDARESADERALKNLLLRGELTGDIGDIGEGSSRALKRQFGKDFDPSTIKATAPERKIAGITSAAENLGLDFDQEALQKLYFKEMGLEIPDPAAEAMEMQKQFESHSEMLEAIGEKDSPPPAAWIKKWEKSTQQPWPTVTRIDPITGQSITRQASYKGKEQMTPEKFQDRINKIVSLAQGGSIFSNNKISPDKALPVIEAEAQSIYGDDWKQSHPEVVEQIMRTLQAYGIELPSDDTTTAPTTPGGQGVEGVTKSGVKFMIR